MPFRSHLWLVNEQAFCSPGCEREHTQDECLLHGDPIKRAKCNKRKRKYRHAGAR